MAEVKDLENLEQEQAVPAAAPAMEAAEAGERRSRQREDGLRQRWQAMPRKKRRKYIRLLAVVLVLAILAGVLLKLFGGQGGGDSQVVTDIVQYGAITSTVQGSGLTKAKSSETITLTTAGTVVDVLVNEGDTVTAGTTAVHHRLPGGGVRRAGGAQRRGGL